MKQTIFKLNVLSQHDAVDIDKEALIAHIDKSNELFTEDRDSTRTEDTRIEWNDDLQKILDAAVALMVKEGLVNKGVKFGVPKGEFWAHIHEKNMSTNTHHHGHAPLSVVYWLSVPEGSGSLRFHLKPEFLDTPIIDPQENSLIVFPGWVEHSVGRNYSDERRISISMNLFPERLSEEELELQEQQEQQEQQEEEPAIEPEVV